MNLVRWRARGGHTLRLQTPSTYVPMELVIQCLACVGTLGTFSRVLHENSLSPVFLSLPGLVMLSLVARIFPDIRQDVSTMSTINGAVTGIVAGFLSSVSWPDGAHLTKDLPQQTASLHALRYLELLYIPVVMGTLLYSFCLAFERLPSWRKVFLTSMMSLCASVMVTLLTEMLSDLPSGDSQVKVFLFTFVNFFLLGMLSVTQTHQRPYVLLLVCLLITLNWQMGYFNAAVWDWSTLRFPVPGSLTALLFVFLVSCQDSRGENLAISYKRRPVRASDKDEVDWMLNTVVWHVITYVIERISLTFLIWQSHASVPATNVQPDAHVACILLVGYLGLVSPHFPVSPLTKLAIIILSLMSYIIYAAVNDMLENAFFLETIFGLSLFYVTNVAQAADNHKHW